MSSKLKAGTATSGAVIDADTTGILELQTGSTPTTAVTITTGQNVGIGTTSPNTKLHVEGSGNTYVRIKDTLANGYNAANLYENTDRTFRVGTLGGVGGFTGGAFIVYDETAGAWRMVIDSSGNVLVNTTTLNSGKVNIVASGASQPCMIWNDSDATSASQGIVSIRRNGSAVGLISTTNSITTYASLSDYRLKENIAPMTGALDTVSALKPVTYKWKSTGEESQGFIAHELQAIVPDCVTGEKDELDADGKPKYQGVDTSFLVATLTAAIKEQQAMIEELKTKVAALEAK